MLLGQVDMEKRFMDLDGLEQQERLNEDMESGLELEYAFDTEDEVSGDGTSGNAGMPESFVIGEAGTEKPPVMGNDKKSETSITVGTGKPEVVPDNGKPVAGANDKAADSISYRLFHWKFSVEQKEEVKRAMAVRVPKEVILSYFYPETSVVRMMEIRRRYE